jgi:hypothetical protein
VKPLLIYVASKYRGPDAWIVEQNIRAAEALAYEVALRGAYPVAPHACTRGYFESAQASPDFWLSATLELMRRCDAVVMLHGWTASYGATVERREALAMGKPVWHQDDDETLDAFLARLKARTQPLHEPAPAGSAATDADGESPLAAADSAAVPAAGSGAVRAAYLPEADGGVP